MVIDSFHLIRALDHVDRRELSSSRDNVARRYCHELLGNLFYWTMQGRYLNGVAEAYEKARQGASSWEEYIRNGSCDLATAEEAEERLMAPAGEDYIDEQARALSQAWEMLKDALLETA